jgi:uncharacterized protein YbbK (DUF523 family)
MNSDMSTLPPVRIGISSCLLGENVRFDGNHKRDAFLVEVFGRHVTWVPVCPGSKWGSGCHVRRCGWNGMGTRSAW